ncbi:MAG TPA: class I SAM-dependent methyltransferase [Acidimicrobiales bacterium]|jgi:2-polyprenyl-3-methyl-5-hydroxy-6-metoxy-1,4-benzoquinol methylase|nr:class I SAM-dependent methyltransferase [Acidimicrobiales bacterium]
MPTAIRTVDLPCTGCGATRDETIWTGREHEYDNTTDDEFPVVRCQQCGLVRLNPRPDVSELSTIYPPNYYAYSLVEEASDAERPGLISRLTQWPKVRMYQRRLARVLQDAGATSTVRLLDVGCADGRLLDWYKAGGEGGRLETFGIDINADAVAEANRRGHRAVVGRFEADETLERGSFNVILASHVIEHVDDPKGFAQRAFDLLVPGGVFVAATPNVDSADVRLFRGNWGGCHFPRHWTFYDASTIEALATSVGFEVVRIEYEVNPVFWVWSFHSLLRDRLHMPRFADRLFPTVSIFHPSAQSFVLLSVFTVVDTVLRAVTGRTASMSVTMKRPVSS